MRTNIKFGKNEQTNNTLKESYKKTNCHGLNKKHLIVYSVSLITVYAVFYYEK